MIINEIFNAYLLPKIFALKKLQTVLLHTYTNMNVEYMLILIYMVQFLCMSKIFSNLFYVYIVPMPTIFSNL